MKSPKKAKSIAAPKHAAAASHFLDDRGIAGGFSLPEISLSGRISGKITTILLLNNRILVFFEDMEQ